MSTVYLFVYLGLLGCLLSAFYDFQHMDPVYVSLGLHLNIFVMIAKGIMFLDFHMFIVIVK